MESLPSEEDLWKEIQEIVSGIDELEIVYQTQTGRSTSWKGAAHFMELAREAFTKNKDSVGPVKVLNVVRQRALTRASKVEEERDWYSPASKGSEDVVRTSTAIVEDREWRTTFNAFTNAYFRLEGEWFTAPVFYLITDTGAYFSNVGPTDRPEHEGPIEVLRGAAAMIESGGARWSDVRVLATSCYTLDERVGGCSKLDPRRDAINLDHFGIMHARLVLAGDANFECWAAAANFAVVSHKQKDDIPWLISGVNAKKILGASNHTERWCLYQLSKWIFDNAHLIAKGKMWRIRFYVERVHGMCIECRTFSTKFVNAMKKMFDVTVTIEVAYTTGSNCDDLEWKDYLGK